MTCNNTVKHTQRAEHNSRQGSRVAPPLSPGPVLEHGVQPLQLLGDLGGVAEPVFPQQGELAVQGRAAHHQQQTLALLQHLVQLVLVLRQAALQTLGVGEGRDRGRCGVNTYDVGGNRNPRLHG